MTFAQELETKTKAIENALRGFLPPDGGDETLFAAMGYSLFAGGKRLRPLLLLAAGGMFAGDEASALPFACALEMIHTYSLIHDDLPAMDDDDLRRGLPTNHKVFGEGMAILAGDGLLNLAFEIMLGECVKNPCPGTLSASREIAVCAGPRGMIAGQALDIMSEGRELSADKLIYLQENKSAKLIRAALRAGALLAGAPEKASENLAKAGMKLGLAFQLKDDLLNIESDENTLGKPVGSDGKKRKQTYIALHGIEKTKNDYIKLSGEAFDIIEDLSGGKGFILPLVKHITSRNR